MKMFKKSLALFLVLVLVLGCLAGFGVALRKAYKSLEGMNGDISGYALSIAELCAVAAYALI